MPFTAQQLLDPGNIVYDDERRKCQERYQKAVERASFLDEREKRNWALLGSLLTKEQLLEGEKLIIDEDLRRLQVRKQLEVIKPIKYKK
jgi:hypothetical protein